MADLTDRGHTDGVVEMPVPASRQPVDRAVTGGRFDGCGAVVGGEVVMGRESANRADVADHGRRDDRAGAVDLRHGAAGCSDDLRQPTLGCAALFIDTSQVLQQLVGELEPRLSDRVGWVNACKHLGGLHSRYLLGEAASDEVAEQCVQATHDPVTGAAQVAVPANPDLHHRGVIFGGNSADVGRA